MEFTYCDSYPAVATPYMYSDALIGICNDVLICHNTSCEFCAD